MCREQGAMLWVVYGSSDTGLLKTDATLAVESAVDLYQYSAFNVFYISTEPK